MRKVLFHAIICLMVLSVLPQILAQPARPARERLNERRANQPPLEERPLLGAVAQVGAAVIEKETGFKIDFGIQNNTGVIINPPISPNTSSTVNHSSAPSPSPSVITSPTMSYDNVAERISAEPHLAQPPTQTLVKKHSTTEQEKEWRWWFKEVSANIVAAAIFLLLITALSLLLGRKKKDNYFDVSKL